MKQKVSSVIKITTKAQLINWVNSLPVYVNKKSFLQIIENHNYYDYVVWIKNDGFHFHYKGYIAR